MAIIKTTKEEKKKIKKFKTFVKVKKEVQTTKTFNLVQFHKEPDIGKHNSLKE